MWRRVALALYTSQANAARRTPSSKFESPAAQASSKQRANALLDDVFGNDHLEFDSRSAAAAAAKQQSAQQNHSPLGGRGDSTMFGGHSTPAAQLEDAHYTSFFGKGAPKTYASSGSGAYKPSIVSSGGAGGGGAGAYRPAATLKAGGQQTSGVLGAYSRMQSQSQAPAGHHMKLLASKPPLNMGSRPPPAAGSNKSNLSKSRSYDSVMRAVSAYPAADYRTLNAAYNVSHQLYMYSYTQILLIYSYGTVVLIALSSRILSLHFCYLTG